MKSFFVSLIILISGCAQLMNGQIQPVVTKNAKEGIYYTTCSGIVENYGSCNRKAMATCKNGYYEIDRHQDSNGVLRALTFKCN